MFIATSCRTSAGRAFGAVPRITKSYMTIQPAQAWLHPKQHYQQYQARRTFGQLPMATEVAPSSPNTKSSTTPSFQSNKDSKDDDQLLIYEGPFAQTARRLKLFSVSSLGATVALCPFIFILDAGISTGMRGGLAVAAVATSGSSTALVQWCLGSYVRKITIPKESSSTTASTATVNLSTPVSFETLSFWGGTRTTTVRVGDLEPSSAPFSTIRIRDGRTSVMRDSKGKIVSQGSQLKKRFYLHAELAEEEPLRGIMAFVEQNRQANAASSKAATATASSSSTTVTSEQTASATVEPSSKSGNMSDRIEELKRKKASQKQ
ncbi:hypothetical protein BGW42_000933 [Actinomortierella wolfii]|nr:hypothetical protein BGW42_000933 [Actinomortierella wolfii]